DNGIPNFLRYAPMEDSGTVESLTDLTTLARQKGWRKALETVYASNPHLIRYVTDQTRQSFLDHIPLSPTSRVLEIGPGLGQFSPELAKRARSVDILEVVPGQAAFVAERCRQSNVENVSIAIGGDDCLLPYDTENFDTVILNLVLEWCGSRPSNEKPEDLQGRLLAEMFRVLRPGGMAFIATKNRFALGYLMGGRDEHIDGMHFGSALPRRMADLILAFQNKPKTRARLHSYPALHRMLRETGFEVVKSLWPIPDMRFPERYVETRPKAVREARQSGVGSLGCSRRIQFVSKLIPAPLIKYVTPGLVFLVRKPSDARSGF
ncbi:MAG: class I SAM-dependent methyltransferase, partial [Nitrospirota bacterium]